MNKKNVASTVLLAALAVTPAVFGQDLVIRNATILTVTGGTIEKGSILVRDGRIAELGLDVSVPSSATVIDAYVST